MIIQIVVFIGIAIAIAIILVVVIAYVALTKDGRMYQLVDSEVLTVNIREVFVNTKTTSDQWLVGPQFSLLGKLILPMIVLYSIAGIKVFSYRIGRGYCKYVVKNDV